MANVLKMPKMSDTMTEGKIVSWQKQVGDEIKSGDILAEIETDKATMELESYDDGTILYIGPKNGEKVAVNSILAIIGKKGEDYKNLLTDQDSKGQETEVKQTSPKDSEPLQNTESIVKIGHENINDKTTNTKDETLREGEPGQRNPNITDYNNHTDELTTERMKVSPLAKKVAQEMGYDLSNIEGTGQYGRIIRRDLENISSQNTDVNQREKEIPGEILITNSIYEESYEDMTISPMRNTIGANLKNSLANAPHFYITNEINMDEVVKMRDILNKDNKYKISYNDIITKACSVAIRRYPEVNVAFMETFIRNNKHIHIGVAVAIKDGLIVPVLKFADTKSLSQISAEIKLLASKAKEKKLSVNEMKGSTFSISNLGMFNIDSFTSIINPPSACILAVGGITKKPIIDEFNKIVVGHTMKITLSCDHRVVDGAIGAKFLQVLKNTLEKPIYMLI